MIKIHTAESEIEAQLIKGYLESHNIKSSFGPGNTSLSLNQFTKGPNVPYDIYVDESVVEEAKKLLAERN